MHAADLMKHLKGRTPESASRILRAVSRYRGHADQMLYISPFLFADKERQDENKETCRILHLSRVPCYELTKRHKVGCDCDGKYAVHSYKRCPHYELKEEEKPTRAGG